MRRIGDYVVEHALDAHTFLATHVVLPRRARVTIAPREHAVEALREACLLEALHHAGVPRIYECGLLSDRRPWLAVELVDGEPVGRLSVAGVVALLRDVAEILDHAHRRGVVHGNLRGEAIVRTPLRRGFPVCLLDWGRARVGDAKADDLRALGEVAHVALVGSLAPIAQRAPGAPPRLTTLLARLAAGSLTAAQVQAEAAALIELVDAEAPLDDAGALAEEVELVELAPEPPRIRWTPPHGSPMPAAGTPIAMLSRRGPR